MRKKRPSVFLRFAIMGACICAGVVVHILYSKIVVEQNTAAAIIIVNIAALTALYTLLQAHYVTKRRRVTEKAKEALEMVKRGEPMPPVDEYSEYAPLLLAVNDLDEFITERETTRSEILSLLNSVASNMELEALLNALLPKVIATSGSAWGAFYINNEPTSKLEIKASLGFSKTIYSEFDVAIGEGAVGMAAQGKRIVTVKDIADDSIFVTRTFLGKVKPKEVMAVPILKGDELVGVLALASVTGYSPAQSAMVTMIQEYIGAAVANSVAFEQHKRIMGELRFQNNLIRDLYDELQNKADSAAVDADDGIKGLCAALTAVYDIEPAFCVLDIHGSAVYATRRAAKTLAGADTDLTGADIYGIFAERERISAFAAAGQGTAAFRLAVGGSVDVSPVIVKTSEGEARYVLMKLEVGDG